MSAFDDIGIAGVPILKTPHDLGQILRARRKALGWDQAQLANQIGVSRQWIIDIEKGKSRAEFGLVLRTIYALGLALQLDPDDAGIGQPASLPSREDPRPSPHRRVDIDGIVDRRTATRTRPFEEGVCGAVREQEHLHGHAKQLSTAIPDDLRKLMRDQNKAAELAKQLSTGLPDEQARTGTAARRRKKTPSSSGKSG